MTLLPTNSSSSAQILNNQICEAVGCLENASDIISVEVGSLGKLALFLCKHCIKEFEDL